MKDLEKEGFLKGVTYDSFKMNTINKTILEGTISIAAKGFGFVTVDKDKPDVFIAPNHTQQALNGDRVKIQVLKFGKSRVEGQVIEVVERERTQFVGTIQMHDKFAFLVPDNVRMNTDIYIPKEKLNGAKDGEVISEYKMEQCDRCSMLTRLDVFGYQKGYGDEKVIWFCKGCR